ncbi:hypothetical protein CFN78_15260 [Amycolatopsis antarctica]|uniref:Cytochrome P450 n=1 Tax=Amycolatopsis antarctica TaxID=1854586 RepID=A0A263D1M0_9PSEU|nr:cytochrome P450 [Amycolatopsis antarctica]OZM72353.1 hypothetical protein CFN78_15260 [Amycolatopsis antarctica]
MLFELDDDFYRDPFSRFDGLREQAPVHVLHGTDGSRFWLVLGSAEIRTGLRDPRLSKDPGRIAAARVAQRRDAGLEEGASGEQRLGQILEMGEFMRSFTDEVRVVVKDELSGEFARTRAPVYRNIADRLLADLATVDGPLDLVSRFTMPYATHVTGALLGYEEDELPAFGGYVAGWMAPDTPEQRAEALAGLFPMIDELIARRRATGGEDIASALAAKVASEGRQDADALVRACLIFILITVETAVSFLATATLALLTHPEQLRLLLAEPLRASEAVEELLRFTGPHNISSQRCAVEDMEIGGREIKEGDLVVFALGAANRDGEHFPEPHCLDITRDTAGHLAFGAGRHYCPGTHQARTSLTIGLSALLDHFPGIALSGPEQEVPWVRSELLRSVRVLPVVLSPERVPSGRPGV